MFVRKALACTLLLALALASLTLADSKPFVGNKNSKKYHVVECAYAQQIAPKNRVPFATAEEAEGAGYVPCKVCRPQNKKKP